MGAQGNETGDPGDLILDAGALIAFDRGDERVKGLLRDAFTLHYRVVVPATALAQVWRGGPRSASLVRLIDAGEVDALNATRAKEVGVRLGVRKASDVTDAHVACCASDYQAIVATSDLDDIRSLSNPGESLTLIAV